MRMELRGFSKGENLEVLLFAMLVELARVGSKEGACSVLRSPIVVCSGSEQVSKAEA